MTKSLTEQWREGTLPAGHYYCKLYYNGFKPRIQECVKSAYSPKSCIPMSCGCEGEEVLAPVPSYERIKDLDSLEQFCELILAGEKQEWENIVKRGDRKEMAKWINERKNKTVDRLEKKLEIATKALNNIEDGYSEATGAGQTVRQALKEMEGVK